MKFVISKEDFKNVLSRVQGITGRRTNLAITETVLIESGVNGIRLSATDTETGIEGFYPATIEEEGIIAINSRKLFEIIRDFPSSQIVVNEVENRWIEIGNEKIEYHIVGMNPDDFPNNPKFEDVTFFEVDSAAFKTMIEQTSTITGATDETRPFVLGVYFETVTEPDGEILSRMVSTDGSRLAKVDYAHGKDADISLDEPVMIPKKGLIEIAKFLEYDGTVQVGSRENHFIIQKENETFTICLLEGKYPNYRRIMERDDGYPIKMNRRDFNGMLRRMSILCTENYKGAIFSFGENKLVISATNPEIGESKEEMEIEYDEARMEAAFNPRYFIEALAVIDDEMVDVNILAEDKPCIIQGEVDKTFLSAIMPMKI